MIIKAKHKANFTILSNDVVYDETISDKARGVLIRLLGRPDDWNLNINHLVKTGKDGNASIRSAIRELEKAGYIFKNVTRHPNGRIIGIEYTVYENKGDATNKTEKPTEEYVAMADAICLPPDIQYDEAVYDEAVYGEDVYDEDVVVASPSPSVNEIKDIQKHETGIMESVIKSHVIPLTAPIINTDNKQILKETTTTTPEPKPVQVPDIVAQPMPSSSSLPANFEILNLIPERHRSPMVVTFVNKAIVDYPENELKEAVTYAAGNVKGGSLQFKAYLDKTLKNKWAEGCLNIMQAQGGCLPHHDPETARRHAEGRSWLNGLDIGSLKMLASSGNIAAREELKQRETFVPMGINHMAGKQQYARA